MRCTGSTKCRVLWRAKTVSRWMVNLKNRKDKLNPVAGCQNREKAKRNTREHKWEESVSTMVWCDAVPWWWWIDAPGTVAWNGCSSAWVGPECRVVRKTQKHPICCKDLFLEPHSYWKWICQNEYLYGSSEVGENPNFWILPVMAAYATSLRQPLLINSSQKGTSCRCFEFIQQTI